MNGVSGSLYLRDGQSEALGNTREAPSFLGRMSIPRALVMLSYGVVVPFLFIVLPVKYVGYFLAAVHLVGAIFDPTVCLGNMMAVSLYTSYALPAWMQVMFGVIVILSLLFYDIDMLRSLSGILPMFAGICLVACSAFFGVSSQINTALQMALCIVRVVVLYNYSRNDLFRECLFGYISGGISLIVIFTLSVVRRTANIMVYGRLSLFGDIKAMAIAAAIPMMLILCSRLEGKKLYSNIGNPIVDMALTLALGLITVLSGARGLIIGIIIVLVLYFLVVRKNAGAVFFAMMVLVFAYILGNTLDFSVFRMERFTEVEELMTGNGRTSLWIEFMRYIWNRGVVGILFGVGPGDIKRLGVASAYAHSCFLDVLFSYGILGFAFVMYFEYVIIRECIKKRNFLAFAINAMLIITYWAHGTATNTAFYSLQVILSKVMSSNAATGTVEEPGNSACRYLK